MAIGFEDEFDYLDDESLEVEAVEAPIIKGAKDAKPLLQKLKKKRKKKRKGKRLRRKRKKKRRTKKNMIL